MYVVYVYVLKGDNGKRYTGITNDINRRLAEHRRKETMGGKLLSNLHLFHVEKYNDYPTAREREKYLKSGIGRKWLDELEFRTGPAKGG